MIYGLSLHPLLSEECSKCFPTFCVIHHTKGKKQRTICRASTELFAKLNMPYFSEVEKSMRVRIVLSHLSCSQPLCIEALHFSHLHPWFYRSIQSTMATHIHTSILTGRWCVYDLLKYISYSEGKHIDKVPDTWMNIYATERWIC